MCECVLYEVRKGGVGLGHDGAKLRRGEGGGGRHY